MRYKNQGEKSAYAKRMPVLIYLRRAIHASFVMLRELTKFFDRQADIEPRNISFFPQMRTEDEVIELLNRIQWYFPRATSLKILIPASKDICGNASLNARLEDVCESGMQVSLVNEEETSTDQIFLTKFSSFTRIPHKAYKTVIVDKNHYSITEGAAWQRALYRTLSQEELAEGEEMSRRNYKDFKKFNINKKNSYCFVTGPSFDQYKKFQFPQESLKIICNSIVKNKEFLDYINGPDALVFSDPVFHFSHCDYAEAFRQNVLEVVEEYGCFVFVPNYTFSLLLRNYPQLSDRLIGVEMRGLPNPHFPSESELYVLGTSNILTCLMLPLASGYSDNIFILGADGRDPNERYFWKHSSSVQYDDLMNSVFSAHPSFFRDRDYGDYYKEHCEMVMKQIDFGESLGKKYYSLTNSFIPALSDRMMDN